MKKIKDIKGVTKKVGAKPGKTIAIFAGVHGDEKAGLMTIEYLKKNLEVVTGTVYLVCANELAIEQRVRFIEKNLNRSFIRSATAPTYYEEVRAKELMDLLDTCDALLDLHSYHEPSGDAIPFAICEPNCYDIVKTFDVPIIVAGFDVLEQGGSDGYMYNNGKPGICVELGAIENPEKFVSLGINTAYQFMQYFGCVANIVEKNTRDQTLMCANSICKKMSSDFAFSKNYKTFDKVVSGEIIATDYEQRVVAKEDGFILFPHSGHAVGVEVCIFAS